MARRHRGLAANRHAVRGPDRAKPSAHPRPATPRRTRSPRTRRGDAHSMLTAMHAVDGIVAGKIDKQALWEINTEQEYHEEKAKS